MSISDIRYLPRWVVMVIDLMLSAIAVFFSYALLAPLNISLPKFLDLPACYLVILGIQAIFMYLFRTYSGIIRHSTFIDLFKIMLACLCTGITLMLINLIVYWVYSDKIFLKPFIAIYFATSFMLLFLFRLAVKEFFYVIREIRKSHKKQRLLVLGIDEQSVSVAHAVMENPVMPYALRGFLTQRNDSKKAKLLGKEIISKNKLQRHSKEQLGIDGVLMIKEMLAPDEMNEWVNLFLEKDLKVYKVPAMQKMRTGDFSRAIRELQIEDLLNRKPIKIENEEIRKRHFGKTVLVTGGAGSIGSEIVRQVAKFSPKLIVVLDQAETPLHEISLEMEKNFPEIEFKFVLADVTNKERVEQVFRTYKFSMVYHAAAYKHVPLVEDNPHEGVLANILGSSIVASLASQYKINRFVMVSTDKAVNPTNVMGATKRAAELFVQSLQNVEGNTTKFITTRFGNVLGSNGSVIPHFKKQIEHGGPVTITHPDIVRYFMTIPEACELVLQAGTIGNGGEIYVFDMGEPVKIVDLAKRMIKLSGLEPDVDIQIIYTGLRPGEKLYEELLSDDTRTMPTHHQSIMISKDPTMAFSEINQLVEEIVNASRLQEQENVVRILKKIVPEFKSNNSIYETLDK